MLDAASGELRTLRVPERAAETTAWLAGLAGSGAGRLCGRAHRLRPRTALRSHSHRLPGGSALPRSRAHPATRSRPIAATPSAWLTCCARASWSRSAVPATTTRSARDLVSAREDARAELMRARHRLSKMLLRHGLDLRGAVPGAPLTMPRFAARRLAEPTAQAALIDSYAAALPAKAQPRSPQQRDRRARRSSHPPPSWSNAFSACADSPPSPRLRSRSRSATGIASRARSARPLPGAHLEQLLQRRARDTLGPITKTGNTHVRRLLVEAAWHQRRPPRAQPRARASPRGQPARRARPRRGEPPARLHRRWHALETPTRPALDTRGRRRHRARAGRAAAGALP